MTEMVHVINAALQATFHSCSDKKAALCSAASTVWMPQMRGWSISRLEPASEWMYGVAIGIVRVEYKYESLCPQLYFDTFSA